MTEVMKIEFQRIEVININQNKINTTVIDETLSRLIKKTGKVEEAIVEKIPETGKKNMMYIFKGRLFIRKVCRSTKIIRSICMEILKYILLSFRVI
jgi:hypothetical protein